MSRSHRLLRFVPSYALLAASTLAQATASAPTTDRAKDGMPTLEQVVATLKGKESAAKSVVMELETTANFPSPQPGMAARVLKTKGALRVLGKTHVHVKMSADFGDGMIGENETVKTPDGVWTRERDPVQGTVFTFMKPELLKKLDEALAALGEGHEVAGVPNRIDEARGSEMIESLRKSFELEVDRRIGAPDELLVIKGKARKNAPKDPDSDLPDPDSVEILVREKDGMIAAMRQFKDGNSILEVKITSLELNQDLDPASFKIAAEGVKFIDAMDHPPMKEQIQKILKDAGMKEPAPKGTEKK